MRQSEECVDSPEREVRDGVPLRLYVQVVQLPQTRQGVQLGQTVDVGRVEHEGLG